MATSSGPIDTRAFPAGAFNHIPTGYRYAMKKPSELEWSKGGRYFRLPMSYYIGSGTVARSFSIEHDGFLYQAPVAYYSATSKWDLSPGYNRYSQPYVVRPILPGCLQCHASGIQHREGTQNGYADPPFREGGVSCERCHGPGSDHIAKPSRTNIINPAKLTGERRDSICAQCHLTGEVRLVRAGRTVQSYRPGEILSNHIAVFTRANDKGGMQGDMRVTSHVEDLAQSKCQQESGGKMWCGTCHDPHTLPSAVDYKAKCQTCHEPHTCGRGDNCVSCHMPKNPVSDAQHVVFTNHSIPRKPRTQAVPPSVPTTLAPFGAGKSDDRDMGIAYAMLGLRDQAFSKLQAARNLDAEAMMYLADLHIQRGEQDQAIRLLEQAIRLDPNQLTASVALGSIRMAQGNYAEAIRLWKDALAKSPGLLLTRTSLAAALLQTGAKTEAQAILNEARKFNPEFTPPQMLLDQLK